MYAKIPSKKINERRMGPKEGREIHLPRGPGVREPAFRGISTENPLRRHDDGGSSKVGVTEVARKTRTRGFCSQFPVKLIRGGGINGGGGTLRFWVGKSVSIPAKGTLCQNKGERAGQKNGGKKRPWELQSFTSPI